MTQLPTIEIHSPKDASQKWIINEQDYDPAKHVKWGDDEVVNEVLEVSEPGHERAPMVPSVPDFVTDEEGAVILVNVIDPDRRTSRRGVSLADYEAGGYELWSSHPRFNR